jgi:crotonobetainyl-CoA:carnitine CoA-transferase CaiB-like acyl-CoA transferase
VYDVFTVRDGEQIFLAAVSDSQWATFCDVLGFADLKADARYQTNNARVKQREALLPELRERLAAYSAAELSAIFEKAGLPFAPIVKPEALFEDPHLMATGGLADVRLTDGPRAGQMAQAALLPLSMDGHRLGVRNHPPTQGQDTESLLDQLGLPPAEITRLKAAGAVA